MDKLNNKNKCLHEGHRARMRRRYRIEGFDSFEDHQFLEFLLFYAHPRKDTNDLAHLLLNHFGSFDRVLDAPVEELVKVSGIGEHSAIFLKTLPEVSRRYRICKLDKTENPLTIDEAGKYLTEYYMCLKTEVVTMILLDNSQRMISLEIVHKGALNSSEINVRRIVEIAITKGAASIILAHNHPDGDLIPSNDDLSVTKHLIKTLKSIDIHFKEHILVANGRFLPINRYIMENAVYEPRYIAVRAEDEE